MMTWHKYPDEKPTKYGMYLVYRAGAGEDKWHKEIWNSTGWAYSNKEVTHWCDVQDNLPI